LAKAASALPTHILYDVSDSKIQLLTPSAGMQATQTTEYIFQHGCPKNLLFSAKTMDFSQTLLNLSKESVHGVCKKRISCLLLVYLTGLPSIFAP
jgi:hypothetical protein